MQVFQCQLQNFQFAGFATFSHCDRVDQAIQKRRSRLPALFLTVVIMTLPFLFLACASVQRRMIYFPPAIDPTEMQQTAAANGLERWKGSRGEFIGWLRRSSTHPSAGQMLIFHGNGGCAFQCSHYADVIQQNGAFDVFMAEYPGYGDRPGKPTQQSIEESALNAFDALDLHRPTYIIGESLGTGVACYVAGHYSNDVTGVILLAPYTSLVDVARTHTVMPIGLFLRDRYPAEQYLRHYRGPTAMLVAEGDTVVPAKLGKQLYENYTGPKRLWVFPGGNHGTVMQQPAETWREIISFLQSN